MRKANNFLYINKGAQTFDGQCIVVVIVVVVVAERDIMGASVVSHQ